MPCPARLRASLQAAGFLLGLLMAWCFYRQLYASVMGEHAGVLAAAVQAAGGRAPAAGSSRMQLLYVGSNGELQEQQAYGAADDKV